MCQKQPIEGKLYYGQILCCVIRGAIVGDTFVKCRFAIVLKSSTPQTCQNINFLQEFFSSLNFFLVERDQGTCSQFHFRSSRSKKFLFGLPGYFLAFLVSYDRLF